MLMNRPTETTAPTTEFCSAKIEGLNGYLWIDGNSKITAGNGTFENPNPNAFSIVQVLDCPGATETCRSSCYVHQIEKYKPEIHDLYKHNSSFIREILKEQEMSDSWSKTLSDWININCQGGFRWHVSGDIFSLDYAKWIANVCKQSMLVNHWIYTRSFDMIAPLLKTQNLVVNISADKDNYQQAKAISEKFNLKLCYLTIDGKVPETITGDVIFPDYNLRGGNLAGQTWYNSLSIDQRKCVCPVDYHGKSETRRCGPCNRCMI